MIDPATDRRRFLLSSAALAVGSLGAGEDQPPVRVAVVWHRRPGVGPDPGIIHDRRGRESWRFCDDYPPHLERGREYAGPKARGFADLAAMLHEAAPAALVVATPLDRHFAMCREAIAAGCDVFCEKTMCYSIDEARDLAALVANRGVRPSRSGSSAAGERDLSPGRGNGRVGDARRGLGHQVPVEPEQQLAAAGARPPVGSRLAGAWSVGSTGGSTATTRRG